MIAGMFGFISWAVVPPSQNTFKCAVRVTPHLHPSHALPHNSTVRPTRLPCARAPLARARGSLLCKKQIWLGHKINVDSILMGFWPDAATPPLRFCLILSLSIYLVRALLVFHAQQIYDLIWLHMRKHVFQANAGALCFWLWQWWWWWLRCNNVYLYVMC